MSGSLIGTISASGVCLVITVWLLVGHRGKGKLANQHEDHHTSYWMLAFGLFSQGAAQAFSAPKQVGDAVTASIDSQFNAGAGAIALIMFIILFGTKPRWWKDVVCGATLPASAMAAAGVLAIPFTVAGSFLHGLFGVAA
ncbi:hypothetical protein ACFQ0T_43250 [Kitasatospora gansuensis]